VPSQEWNFIVFKNFLKKISFLSLLWFN
jgi:hypothetical protein